MSNTWTDLFGDLLRAKGYGVEEIYHDPAFGWLVGFSDDDGEREFIVRTTTAVETRIHRLPQAKRERRHE